MGRPLPAMELTPEERQQLAGLAASRSLPHALVARARLVLWAAEGIANQEIALRLGWSKATVGKWRKRFVERRLIGVYDDLRPGRPRSVSDEQIAVLLRRTLKQKPPAGTHWTVRLAAEANGLSKSCVHRAFQLFALQPHRSKSFKLSNDPFFVEKVRGVVGLYLNPPDHAIVLSVDEKSQIQALDRTQPVLPMGIWVRGRSDSRLCPQRHHYFVCRPRYRLWKRAHRVQAAPPPSGVPWVSQAHRRGRACNPGRAPDPGQLCHSQARQGARVAGRKAALPSSFHAHLLVLVQPGRAMVRPHHPTDHPPRLIQKRQRTDRQNQPIRPALQP